MKKQDFIDKYGIEKYKRQLEKNRLRAQQWNVEHPDYHQQWNAEHSDYYQNYYQAHKEEMAKYYKKYYQTQKGRANNLVGAYIQRDSIKGQECDLTPEWIMDNIFTSKCYYCEDSDWTHLGCDRIDNSKGHTKDNVICACSICNVERSDRIPVEEFKQYRQLHPRGCDIPKQPILNPNGCISKKRVIY